MTQEEKAKAYDEAIKRANELLYVSDKESLQYQTIKHILPELIESEGEKIRKAIHIYLDWLDGRNKDYHPKGVYTIKDMIDWIEKQATPQVRTGIEWVNTIDDACDERYAEEYSHGEYCHEQSFKWGFQEGVEWLEKQGQVKESIISQHENKMCKENDEPLTSEDERIRKELIEQVVYIVPNDDEVDSEGNLLPIYQKRIDKYRAWLEKQGEHANFRNKIEIGDKVTRNEDGVLVNLSQLNRVAKKQDEQKPIVNDNAKEMFIKALERVEEQNAKGYKLTDCDKNSWWEDFKNYTSCTIEQKPTGWSEKLIADVFEMVGLAKIVREQENDALTRALQSAMIELAKYSVVPQIRQEWSEEDESRIGNLCHFLEEYGNQYYGCLTLQGTISWLKSLRPQNAWKPSDEQMSALSKAIAFVFDSNSDVKHSLESLYNELKKL